MIYRDRRGSREVLPGWAALSLTGEHSSYGISAGMQEHFESFWISFSGSGMPEHWNDIRSRFGTVVQLGQRSVVLDHMKALCQRARPRSTAESVQHASQLHSLFRTLYAFLESASTSGKSSIERAVDELANCSDGKLSVKEVAARHGLSREHFTRVFSARQGISPARFLARAKLARATALLLETQLPVVKIAQQCGFGSKQALIRWMKREAGCLPGELRRQRNSRIR
jgi:AraC-like DNA-binding protein